MTEEKTALRDKFKAIKKSIPAFEREKKTKIGVCFQEQVVDSFASSTQVVTLDIILTDKEEICIQH